jgi:hypothetical protein
MQMQSNRDVTCCSKEWMNGITRGNQQEMETNYPVEILMRFKLA